MYRLKPVMERFGGVLQKASRQLFGEIPDVSSEPHKESMDRGTSLPRGIPPRRYKPSSRLANFYNDRSSTLLSTVLRAVTSLGIIERSIRFLDRLGVKLRFPAKEDIDTAEIKGPSTRSSFPPTVQVKLKEDELTARAAIVLDGSESRESIRRVVQDHSSSKRLDGLLETSPASVKVRQTNKNQAARSDIRRIAIEARDLLAEIKRAQRNNNNE